MSTPVLLKDQQKKSLSAKKGPVKGLRNVLALPYERFWPVLKHDEGGLLEKVLRKSLPVLKRPSVNILWKDLCKMTKEERTNLKKTKQSDLPDPNMINNVVVGINAVTRSLEKNKVSSVLLDATVDPALIVKHIVTMSVDKGIPVLLIPFLKNVTLDTMGFSTAAIAFKNEVAEESTNHFFKVHEVISQSYKQFPVPKTASKLFDLEDSPTKSSLEQDSMNVDESVSDMKPTPISSDVYKYRNSVNERVFVPTMKSKSIINFNDFIPMDEDNEYDNRETIKVKERKRYIDFSNDVEQHESEQDLNTKCYIPLKVKRLQGSENRLKATKDSKSKKRKA